jgi:hypothetical protein
VEQEVRQQLACEVADDGGTHDGGS